MTGRLRSDGTAEWSDPAEASTLYARGYFGTLQPGGGLRLDRYETAYLTEMGRAEVQGPRAPATPWPEVFRRAARAEPGFGVRYLVYRDLRQRGYVVRSSPPPIAFAVLPRGGTLNKTPARYWVDALSERSPFDLGHLLGLTDRAQATKKSLLLGVVDEESDLTYYRLKLSQPTGALTAAPLDTVATGWLSEDRVLLFDPGPVASLGRNLAYGSQVGARLELSLLEAAYLQETGQLVLRDARSGRAIPRAQFDRRAARLDRRFDERLATYRHLRGRRLVVKTGFKYGAHFRAYPRNPEQVHARYLVQAVPMHHVAAWSEIAGAVRVAQGVRKEFLLAAVDSNAPPRFLAIERIRP